MRCDLLSSFVQSAQTMAFDSSRLGMPGSQHFEYWRRPAVPMSIFSPSTKGMASHLCKIATLSATLCVPQPVLAQEGCKGDLGSILDDLGPSETSSICKTASGWRLGLVANMRRDALFSDGSFYQLLALGMSRSAKLERTFTFLLEPVAQNIWKIQLSRDGEVSDKPIKYFLWARLPFEVPLELSKFNETDVRVFRCHSRAVGSNTCGTSYNVPLCDGYKSPAWQHVTRAPEPGLGADIDSKNSFVEILSAFDEINEHAESVMGELFAHSCNQ